MPKDPKHRVIRPLVWEPGKFSTFIAEADGQPLLTIYDETATNGTWAVRGPIPNSDLNIGDFDTLEEAKTAADDFMTQYVNYWGVGSSG